MKSHWPLISLLLLNSCASYFFGKPPQDRTWFYVGDTKVEEQISSDEMKEKLSKDFTFAGGNYFVKLFPISKPYLLTKLDEMAALRGLDTNQKLLVFQKWEKEYLHNKNCFEMQYAIIRFEKAVKLEGWKLFFLNKNDNEFPMRWKERPVASFPYINKSRRAMNVLDEWNYQGVACTNFSSNLREGFGIRVQAPWIQFPFTPSESIFWDFNKFSLEDGKEVELDTKKKRRKPYRGW